MIHGSHHKALAVSSVRASGHNGNLPKGEFAIVKDKYAGRGKGLEVVTSYAAMTTNDKIQINVGEATTPSNLRINEVPVKSTGWFQIKDVIEISAEVPTQTKLVVDWLEVGYDGINANSALYIPEGKSAVLDFLIHGEVASMFFGRDEFLVSKEVFRPVGATMQEVITKTVKELNEERVPSSMGFDSLSETLSNYMEIGVIDSSNIGLTGAGQTLNTVQIPDNGDSNDLAAVQAQYPNYVVAVLDRKEGVTTYGIIAPTADVIADAVITIISNVYKDCDTCPDGYVAADLEGYCTKITENTYTWIAGEECFTSTTDFTIILPDTECGVSRLAELEAFYSDLVVTETTIGTNCNRQYTTTVITNAVCSECSNNYLQPFYGEAPVDFEGVSWEASAIVYDETAKMGIYVKGKPFYMYPETYEEDFVPYIETSLKIKSISFGASGSLILNYTGEPYDPELEFAKARRVTVAADVNNNAVAMFGAEDIGNKHYANTDRHKANLFARTNLSQERILKYHKKYVQYFVKWRDNNLSQGGASRSDITHQLGFIVEYGKHTPLQTALNALATKAGVTTVNIP